MCSRVSHAVSSATKKDTHQLQGIQRIYNFVQIVQGRASELDSALHEQIIHDRSAHSERERVMLWKTSSRISVLRSCTCIAPGALSTIAL